MEKMLSVAELLRAALLEEKFARIELSRKHPVVSYVRARETIDEVLPARDARREAKMRVIEYLGGVKKPGKEVRPGVCRPSFVEFQCEEGKTRKAQF